MKFRPCSFLTAHTPAPACGRGRVSPSCFVTKALERALPMWQVPPSCSGIPQLFIVFDPSDRGGADCAQSQSHHGQLAFHASLASLVSGPPRSSRTSRNRVVDGGPRLSESASMASRSRASRRRLASSRFFFVFQRDCGALWLSRHGLQRPLRLPMQPRRRPPDPYFLWTGVRNRFFVVVRWTF